MFCEEGKAGWWAWEPLRECSGTLAVELEWPAPALGVLR